MYGLPPGSSSPRFEDWIQLVHPEDREAAARDAKAALAGEPYDSEFRVIWPDGSLHWLSAKGKTILEDGVVTRLVGANVDITARKTAEEELKRSNRDLEQFAYMASHDLQEPLRTVRNYCELLKRQIHQDPRTDKLTQFIVDGTKRMQHLIFDLLAYASLGRNELSLGPVSLDECVAEALTTLQDTIEKSQATVILEAMPSCACDREQIVQLFQNLIGNAMKYRSDRAPRVHVSATIQSGSVIVSVADNGIGLESRFRDEIFQPFKRLHNRSEYPGTGIGLAICKRVVERHGGRIWVESEVGVGSTFFFSLVEPAAYTAVTR